MPGPWDSYAPGTPESKSENWTQRVDENGQAYWSYLGGSGGPSLTYEASPPPADYGIAPAQPSYNITGGGDYTGYAAPGAPPQPAYDPLSSAYPVSEPTPYTGTPGTGSGIANPYDPSQVAAGEQAAYETLLANGAIPLVGGEAAPAAAPVAPAPGAPSTAIAPGNPAPADPYGLSATTDPFTGQTSYDASYSTGGGGSTNLGGGGEWGMPGMPSFGGQATNPGRQQPVIPGQFDPFAWSGNPNPMGMMAPNEMREMVLGAMQLGAEIQQQQTEPPRMDARQYALHRLGLMEPEEQAPPVPFLPPRAPFGG